MINKGIPTEEISPIINGFAIETATQSKERDNFETLRELKAKYGGLTNTSTNIVKALGYDGLQSLKQEGTTEEQDKMLDFLKTDLGINIETGWKTDEIELEALKVMIKEKVATLEASDMKRQTAIDLEKYIETCEQDIAKGLELYESLYPKR